MKFNNTFFSLFIFFSLNTLSFSKYIVPFAINNSMVKTEVDYFGEKNLIANITIGNPEQTIQLSFLFNTFFTWVCSDKNYKRYNHSLSSSYSQKGKITLIEIEDGLYTAMPAHEKFNIGSNTMHNFLFMEVGVCPKGKSGGIGLAKRDVLYTKFFNSSITLQLYQKKIIDFATFNLRYFDNKRGEISFGSLPYKLKEDKFVKFEFGAPNCYESKDAFPGISLTNNSETFFFNISEKVLISPNSFFLVVPEKVFLKIYEKIFRRFVEKATCSLYESQRKKRFISCNNHFTEKYIENATLIIFIDQNQRIEIPVKNLFYPFYSSSIFGIVTLGSEKEFVIGEVILRNLISVFNHNDNSVKFYSKELIKEGEETRKSHWDNSLISNIFTLISIINFLGIGNCILYKIII